MKPRLSLLDPKFIYRNSSQTDVRETIERERTRLLAEGKQQEFNQHRIVAIGRKKVS